jgi:hypothetical protein
MSDKTVRVTFAVSVDVVDDVRDLWPFIESLKQASLDYWKTWADTHGPVEFGLEFGTHTLSTRAPRKKRRP